MAFDLISLPHHLSKNLKWIKNFFNKYVKFNRSNRVKKFDSHFTKICSCWKDPYILLNIYQQIYVKSIWIENQSLIKKLSHLFARLFVISWENSRDCHITMPLSLKTMKVYIKGAYEIRGLERCRSSVQIQIK